MAETPRQVTGFTESKASCAIQNQCLLLSIVTTVVVEAARQPLHSVTEVEVIVGVGVILALSEYRADEVESAHGECNAHPHAEGVIDDDTVDEEALETTIHEMEEPLLGRVGTMVEDVTTSVGGLLIEILLAIPRTPLGLGHTHTLTVTESHVPSVALLVMG